eukprot:9363676-Alexandrium_andersonii.AAC.1
MFYALADPVLVAFADARGFVAQPCGVASDASSWMNRILPGCRSRRVASSAARWVRQIRTRCRARA